MLSFGFAPVVSPNAQVMILGSLPSRISLERGEYYANPQNAFWKIIGARIDNLPADYPGRVTALSTVGIALWDVLAAATRSGSLDAEISDDAIPNNFRALFHAYPRIQSLCFNGATAGKLYERCVVSTLSDSQRAITRRVLPSSSSAHAQLSFAEKSAQWSAIWNNRAATHG